MSHLAPERALALVALAADDAERIAAYRHAATCPACAALLREHEAMLHGLDAVLEPAVISPALAARVQARVFPPRWPRLVLVSVWLASLALVLGVQASSETAAVGSHCVLSEALFAIAPLGVGAWLSRAGRVHLDPLGFAAITGGGGLLGQWWLRTHCPVNGATLHAFVFHFLVVLALSLLGGLLGTRLSALRA